MRMVRSEKGRGNFDVTFSASEAMTFASGLGPIRKMRLLWSVGEEDTEVTRTFSRNVLINTAGNIQRQIDPDILDRLRLSDVSVLAEVEVEEGFEVTENPRIQLTEEDRTELHIKGALNEARYWQSLGRFATSIRTGIREITHEETTSINGQQAA